MKDLIKFAARHPWMVLAGIAAVTGLALWQIHRLQVHISVESLLERESPAWSYLVSVEETFGGEDVVVVVIRDPALFEAEKLAAIRDRVGAIERLPFVSGTLSLFNVPNLRSRDGVIHTRPFLETFPANPDEVARLKAEAVRNPLVLGNLISADGRTIAIDVFLKSDLADPGFDERVTTALEASIAPLRGTLSEVFQIGASVIGGDLSAKVRSDQVVILPLSILVLLLTLAVGVRRARAALIPLLTAGLSIVWTLGFMAALGIPLNVLTSIVPALLVIIGSTEDIHLLAEFSEGRRNGHSPRGAIARMADKVGLAVLLTFVTTYLGFLTIALNDIELLFQFGLVASTGLAFNFVITVLLVPVMLRCIRPQAVTVSPSEPVERRYQRWADRLLGGVQRRAGLVYGTAGLMLLLALLAATQLRINNNLLDYLDDASPLWEHSEVVHRELSGIHAFSVVIESGIADTFLQVRYLEEIRKIQGFVHEMEVFDRSFSFADLVALVNGVMDDSDTSEMRLPESDDVVREYMMFIRHHEVAGYVSPGYDRARILVRHNIGGSQELNRAVDRLRQFVDANVDPALRVEITGKSLLSNQAVSEMARSQLRSLMLVGVVIVALVSLLFVSLRAGFIALVPTLLPVVMLFGVMGATGIPLNLGTGMVAAIALGICVDDNMHVMSRFHEELKRHDSRSAALRATFRAEAMPIMTTSLALAAGFSVFALSSFVPVVHFGLLSAMVIVIALLATFLLTPLLLAASELLSVWDLLSYRVRNRALRQSPLFLGMHDWQIKKLLLASEVRQVGAGDSVVEEGQEGTEEMYVVLDGLVEASKRGADGSVEHLRVMGVGELFGEVAPLSGNRRTADIVALQDTELLVLSWTRIHRLTRRHPLLAFRLFRNLSGVLSERLTRTREYKINERHLDTKSRDTDAIG